MKYIKLNVITICAQNSRLLSTPEAISLQLNMSDVDNENI
jgi:hypothetical protein